MLEQLLNRTTLSKSWDTSPLLSSTAAVAQRGNNSISLSSHAVSKDNSIVETGASGSYKRVVQCFCFVWMCTDGMNISIADVSISQAVGFSNVNLSGMTLTLFYMFLVFVVICYL